MSNEEEPNVNICKIEKIENTANMLMFWLLKLEPTTPEQLEWQKMAQADVKELQSEVLHGLRKAFEDD